jgi:rhodanese-related sulfurtransferase
MEGSSIERVLAESRRRLARVQPPELAAALAAGALVVDTRPAADRTVEGDLPGAVVVERTVLEWRLDPTSPHRIPEAGDPDRRVVVVCNEGYSSSLAAESLQRLGLRNATDLVGGYRAWRRWEDGPWSTAALLGAVRAVLLHPSERRAGYQPSDVSVDGDVLLVTFRLTGEDRAYGVRCCLHQVPRGPGTGVPCDSPEAWASEVATTLDQQLADGLLTGGQRIVAADGTVLLGDLW